MREFLLFRVFRVFRGLCLTFCLSCWLTAPAFAQSFSREIRPILADACFHCHGPDSGQREADLRLDQREGLFAPRAEGPIVVPGDTSASELYRRIASTDPADQMPPPAAKRQLTAEERERIRRWIEAGARWEAHWSFVKPERPALPAVRRAGWARHAWDHFVGARGEAEGLVPSPEADKHTLIRRVTLDLTGLPPTPEEVEAFVGDAAPDAYERLLDRLLHAPRYGEHMAVSWLDAARYADTSGYQNDGPREMWRWRDWVIDALNRDLPFDRFTIEQLAGDLLPEATLPQRIATGFNRNHRGNAEGGIIPEEYAVEYVVDRVDTTFTVWMGLTMGCARCHDHKYDPLSQQDFYRAYAYFNNLPEYGRAIKEGNSPPYITAPTTADLARLAEVDEQLAAAERRVEPLADKLDRAQSEWERAVDIRSLPDGPSLEEGLAALFSPEGGIDARTHPVECAEAGSFGYFQKFSLAAAYRADGTPQGTLLSRMTDVPRGDGYGVQFEQGRLQVFLVKRWLDDSIRVETKDVLPSDGWHHVIVTYDGSRQARGVRVYVDGQPVELVVQLDLLNQTFATEQPFRIGAGGGSDSCFRGVIGEVRVYDRALSADEAAILGTRETLADIVRRPAPRTLPQHARLRAYFLESVAPADWRRAFTSRDRLRRQRQAVLESFPTVMVMEELPQPRPAFVLLRGQYDKPGDAVTRGVPASLPPLPEGAPLNRLGFAQWLVSPEHPLTARVAVNRQWQHFFGLGLVKTSEDFGLQGAPPSHPELLDALAVDFRKQPGEPHAWSVKYFQRQLLNTATYRQSSAASPAAFARDPDNRWLARGTRLRLSAEMIRDQALAASGLLVEQLGGPSVKPYQPADLWQELATDTNYVPAAGAGLYRRSLYTYWKRTVSPPTMSTFDAAGREFCQVRRTATNTPLQSLALLNDVTYVEAARKLAERLLREGGETPAGRIAHGFRLLVARPPAAEELALLERSLEEYRQEFARDPDRARSLLEVGDSPVDARLDPVELAAYATLASVLLSLDEVLTKQ